jgi:uncharacterized protein (DUF952 family)
MILHICGAADAERFRAAGEVTAPSLEEVGFVHCADPGTVALPANRLHRGRTDLVVLEIDPAAVEADVRWEPGDPPIAGGPWFPHVYGPIEFAAVVGVHRLIPDRGGAFVLPENLRLR